MATNQVVAQYIATIQKDYLTGKATELTHRTALEILLESLEDNLDALSDPKRIKAGAPDYVIMRHHEIIAYVEAKDLPENLDKWEKDKQLLRYFDLPYGLILTNHLEFRWYVQGELRQTVRIGRLVKGTLIVDEAQFDPLLGLFRLFLQDTPPISIASAQELAQRMARMAKEIRQLIQHSLPDSPTLKEQKQTFEEVLIPDLKNTEFADMYAQTLTYGLFAARYNYEGAIGTFARRGVADDIPKTNPFLRKLFKSILEDMDERVSWMIDALIKQLAYTNLVDLLTDFGQKTVQNDPILHFYETFLAHFDPQIRDDRGVFYTPEPIVTFIVKSIDVLLQRDFKHSNGAMFEGLADEQTLILDPATGTGTFLHAIIEHIYETAFKNQSGAWDEYVSNKLLNRLFGFELLMASYAVAHIKLGRLLKEKGYIFREGQRLGVYLTNTLEPEVMERQQAFASFLTDEANHATAIKRTKPIMVIVGNPPYSNFGQMNKGKWISRLMQDWKPLNTTPQRNQKWNPEDSLKFIRFGQWRLEQTQQGIMAYIVNSTFLDSISLPKMRQSLLASFSDIYILNLHGSGGLRKREDAPEGIADENVFNIQQGVAVVIFVKNPHKKSIATVHYHDLWGTRAEKYRYLQQFDITAIETTLQPKSPHYFLSTTKSGEIDSDYESFETFENIFMVYQNGIKTDRDDLFFDTNKDTLRQRIREFYAPEGIKPPFATLYNVKNSSSYPLLLRRENTQFDEQYIQPCLYRPFDTRWLYYNTKLISRPAWDVIRHMACSNLALICMRQSRRGEKGPFFVGTGLMNKDAVSPFDIGTVAPLYLCKNGSQSELIAHENTDTNGRVPNFKQDFLEKFAKAIDLRFVINGVVSPETFNPEDVFHYMYAVFHATAYREQYAESLKIGFPRLPLIRNQALFRALVAQGQRLVDSHLLRTIQRRSLITGYPIRGTNLVTKTTRFPHFKENKIYINTTQYIDGVNESLWQMSVGGYQPLFQWLKDRRGQVLNDDDILHYQKIIVALSHTQEAIKAIDNLVPSFPFKI